MTKRMIAEMAETTTHAAQTSKNYRKAKKRGRTWGGLLMCLGGGVVGAVSGLAEGARDVIVELLPEPQEEDESEYEEIEETPVASRNGRVAQPVS